MKKLLLWGVGLLLGVSTLLPTPGRAAEPSLLLGEKHFYSVVWRGNGEAVVQARLTITNADEKPLSEYSFTIPGAEVSELVMYQQILGPICLSFSSNYPKDPEACSQYQDPDYGALYPYYGQGQKNEYKKVEFSKDGEKYKVILPTAIEPNKSGGLILAYSSKSYTEKSLLGAFNYSFSTIKVPARVNAVRVGIDVDSDLYLKGANSSVDYGVASSSMITADAARSPEMMDAVARSIGLASGVVKEGKSLAAEESFVVKGSYADSWFKLYSSALLATLVGIIVILAIIWLLLKRTSQTPITPQLPSFFLAVLLGLASALLLVVLAFLWQWWSQTQFTVFRQTDAPFRILFTLFLILISVTTLFAPLVFIVLRQGWRSGVVAFLSTCIWLGVFLAAYYLIVPSGANSVSPISPLYDSGIENMKREALPIKAIDAPL